MKAGLDRYTELMWRPFFEDLFKSVKGKTVLDAGCGYARYTKQLRRNNLCKGIDLKKTDFTTDVGSVEKMPYKNEEFDISIAIGLLDYTDPVKTLNEINRVTRMGGTLYLMVPNEANPYHILSATFGKRGKRRYAISEIEKFVEECGFRIDNVVVMGFSFYIPGKLLQYAFIPLWMVLDVVLGSRLGMNIFIDAYKVKNCGDVK